MSSKLLFFIIFGLILTLPAFAQNQPLSSQEIYQQEIQLRGELGDAVKSGDKTKADQLRSQLNALHQQQFALRKQLLDQLHDAVKSKDNAKVQQLSEQLREQFMPGARQNLRGGRGSWMSTDPQRMALIKQLRDAVNSNDKAKADDLRAQINTLQKQHFSQIKQLRDELQQAIKNKDQVKTQQLQEQLMP